MSNFNIHIKQVEKTKGFSLYNFDDQINNMYNDIILSPSRKDLSFFIIIFFAGLNVGKRTFLDVYFEENLLKLDDFIQKLNNTGRKLRKEEYTTFKKEQGLDLLLKYDTFFLLLFAFSNIEYYQLKYGVFFEKNKEILNLIKSTNKQYGKQIDKLYSRFRDIYIEDDRLDDISGETLDLSKSVTRTIEMRLAKKIENSFKQLTKISKITSNSPLDLFFTQDVTPDLIYNIWDQFKVYTHLGYSFISDKQFIIPTSSGIVSGLVVNYLSKKNNDNKKDGITINNVKSIQNNYKNEESVLLLKIISDNLLLSKEKQQEEIKRLSEKVEQLEKSTDKKEKNKLKKIKVKLKNLLNLSVEIEFNNK